MELKNNSILLEESKSGPSMDLMESEERFRALTEKGSDIILIINKKGKFTYASPSIKRYGYSPQDISGNTPEDIVHPDDLSLVQNSLEESIVKPGITMRMEDIRVRNRNGSWAILEGLLTCLYEQPGVNGIVFNGRDITERKHVEEALQQANKELRTKTSELEAANEELSQYAYVVSHDLKAPLRAIHNYADFLYEDLSGILEGDQKEYLNNMNRAIKQGEKLVDDLLEFTRIGRRSLEHIPINVEKLLKELITSLDLPSNVKVRIKNNMPKIIADPTLLRQIFQNLMSNAVKFNNSKQKIVEFGCNTLKGNSCEFYVSDNGIGIKPNHIEKIFLVFNRLHTNKEYEGTGIGLAIVKKAVDKLHGSVRIESKLGFGSTFFIILPKVQKE